MVTKDKAPQICRSVRRLEDGRFLTGRGRYVGDLDAIGCLHGSFVRSPHAHAVIERIDTARASAHAGVRGIYTSADLAAEGIGPLPCMAAVTPLIVPPRPALADGRVRHVGDPVVFAVADSEDAARTAGELVEIDYAPLPSVVDGRAALAANAPVLWDQAPGNQIYHVERGNRAVVAQAMKDAAHVVEIDVMNNRVIVTPIEPR